MLNIDDQPQLISYLRDTQDLGVDDIVSVSNLSGGVSNRTVLVQLASGERWVVKQALLQLRVDVEWTCDPARIHREAAGIRWLAEVLPPNSVPALLFEDPQHDLLIMTAVPQPHRNWKAMLLDGSLNSQHVEQFARLLSTIHSRSAQDAERLSLEFAERAYFEALRLEPYYAYTAAEVPGARAFLGALIEHTRSRQYCIVHGDYSPKNVLVRGEQLVLLDHEVIHWGDPAFDLGFALTHLLSKAHLLVAHRAAFARAAKHFWGVYVSAVSGRLPEAERYVIAHTLGCLLARAFGRSPLEYLEDAKRQHQCEAALALVNSSPETVEELVDQFLVQLSG